MAVYKDYGYSNVDPYTKKKREQLYTIFGKYKSQDKWMLMTCIAPGNNCRDAVERYYGSNPSVEKAIAFPTNSGQEVTPPCTSQWTSRNL